MPGGKSEGSKTEWKTEVTFPVLREITMVAAVSAPLRTTREEASTVIGGCSESAPVFGGVVAGVGYGWNASKVDIVAVL